jgi:hypothetical protein
VSVHARYSHNLSHRLPGQVVGQVMQQCGAEYDIE